MASQTPTAESPRGVDGRMERLRYVNGWAALARMMDRGVSWSGSERNCCFLNLGAGAFADASALSGLDFIDDGRAVASVDWDRDGDLDLWLKNRTGPQLRFLRNDVAAGTDWVSFQLEGSRGNRDAIGARVELTCRGRTSVRHVSGGDGYLSQSSRIVHFGLGPGPLAEAPSIRVRWPGGEVEAFGRVQVNRRHKLIEGAGQPRPLTTSSCELSPGALSTAPPPGAHAIMLRTTLPMPPSLIKAVWGQARPHRSILFTLWSTTCPPCIQELADLADHAPELDAAGLDLIALGIDLPRDRSAASRLFEEKIATRMTAVKIPHIPLDPGVVRVLEALVGHVLGREEGLSLPTSLLFDGKGALQIVYVGGVRSATLLADAGRLLEKPLQGAFRSFYPGRWYFRVPRDLEGLAKALEQAGSKHDAQYYRKLE